MKTDLYLYFFLYLGSAFSNPTKTKTDENLVDDETFASAENTILHAQIGTKKCMEKLLGCFEITPDFYHPLYRPLNLLPHDSATIGTKFNLYTKLQPKEPHVLDIDDLEDIKESPFEPRHKTKFIVHGFVDSTLYGKWMENLKDNILLHGDYNVIIVDWSKGNGAPYTQAAANTRVVGAQIAALINFLEKLMGVSPLDCHIIGHSLGSHIAGYAGERLKHLGRITAIDPAQPYFQNMPPSVRIDPTDADFVDAIHTDSSSIQFLALGMSQAVGHVDFYPNNGMSQPGCTYSTIYSIFLEGLLDAVRQFVSCNHQRAVDFFMYSINFRKAPPVGYHCTSYKDYIDGFCSDCGKDGRNCALMGWRADEYQPFKNDSHSKKFYLTTTGSAPFWAYTYNIKVKLARPKIPFSDGLGTITLKIHGSKNDYVIELSTKSKSLIHGATYSFLITKKEELGKIKKFIFSWSSGSWSSFFSTHSIFLDFVQMTPMNVISKQVRDKETKKFCSQENVPIESQVPVTLFQCK